MAPGRLSLQSAAAQIGGSLRVRHQSTDYAV